VIDTTSIHPNNLVRMSSPPSSTVLSRRTVDQTALLDDTAVSAGQRFDAVLVVATRIRWHETNDRIDLAGSPEYFSAASTIWLALYLCEL
jgi:hypothetical protein